MKFGFFGTAGFKAGFGRVVGARFGGTEKANRSTRVTVDRLDAVDGIGGEWASAKYGDYYATSSAVYAAVRTRADAVGRAELRVEKLTGSDGEQVWQKVDFSHPLQRLIDRPNGSWSRAELVRAIESNLLLWGSAFLGIEKDESGAVSELWPLRPDRMRVIPDVRKYVRGFVYEHAGERAAYLPEEMVCSGSTTRLRSLRDYRLWRRLGCRLIWDLRHSDLIEISSPIRQLLVIWRLLQMSRLLTKKSPLFTLAGIRDSKAHRDRIDRSCWVEVWTLSDLD